MKTYPGNAATVEDAMQLIPYRQFSTHTPCCVTERLQISNLWSTSAENPSNSCLLVTRCVPGCWYSICNNNQVQPFSWGHYGLTLSSMHFICNLSCLYIIVCWDLRWNQTLFCCEVNVTLLYCILFSTCLCAACVHNSGSLEWCCCIIVSPLLGLQAAKACGKPSHVGRRPALERWSPSPAPVTSATSTTTTEVNARILPVHVGVCCASKWYGFLV